MRRYFAEIEKLYEKIKVLREQLELVQTSELGNISENEEIKRISEILEKEGFSFTEYDDVIVRRIVDCIRVMSDKTIIITLKGGLEISEAVDRHDSDM